MKKECLRVKIKKPCGMFAECARIRIGIITSLFEMVEFTVDDDVVDIVDL